MQTEPTYKNPSCPHNAYCHESGCTGHCQRAEISDEIKAKELSVPASPVIEIAERETTDERTYRKESEWHLKQLRECQEKLCQKEMEFTQLMAEFVTLQSQIPAPRPGPPDEEDR